MTPPLQLHIYHAATDEWVRPGTAPSNPPVEPGVSQQWIAHIGDSTSYMSGTGATIIPQQFAVQGWNPNKVWFYGYSSKPMWSAANAGDLTFSDTVAKARSEMGREPDVWHINLGANNAPSSDSTNELQVRLLIAKLREGYVGTFGRTYARKVVFTGVSQSDSTDATTMANRKRVNRITRFEIEKYANDFQTKFEWFDWHREIKGYDQTGLWNADNVHMTTSGYAIKARWFGECAGQPTDIPDRPYRPEGTGFQKWEDLYVAGNTIQQVINKVASGNALTFPEGVFEFSDFANGGSKDGLRIGTSESTQVCRGLIGSGQGTIFRMKEDTSTKVTNLQSTDATSYTLIHLWGQRRAILANFRIEGSYQSLTQFHAGVRFSLCKSPTIKNVKAYGINPGFANEPPGECMGVNFWQSPNAAVIDCEFDGRRPWGDQARTSFSAIAWNTTENAYIRNAYVHHHRGGMPTCWETTDIFTVNYRNEQPSTGSGVLAGHGFNHEKVGGVIRHMFPTYIIERQSGNTGMHITLQNSPGVPDSPHFYDAPDVIFWEPTFDPIVNSSNVPINNGVMGILISANYHSPYGQTQTTPPRVVKNGVDLRPRKSGDGLGTVLATDYYIYQ